MRDFDDNQFPLAYLITFRCYGTWLHGDSRRSMDRVNNIYGTPRIPPNTHLQKSDKEQLKHQPFELDASRRKVVEEAIREVCAVRRYELRAINVRTNHVHVVVTAMSQPEPILLALKSYATRSLRSAGLVADDVRPWARHGSTVYLWKERDVAEAINYVVVGQGEDLFRVSGD